MNTLRANQYSRPLPYLETDIREKLTRRQKIIRRLAPFIGSLVLVTTSAVAIKAAEDPNDSFKAPYLIQEAYDTLDYALTGLEYGPTKKATITNENRDVWSLMDNIKGIENVPAKDEVYYKITKLNPGLEPGKLHVGDEILIPSEAGRNLSDHKAD